MLPTEASSGVVSLSTQKHPEAPKLAWLDCKKLLRTPHPMGGVLTFHHTVTLETLTGSHGPLLEGNSALSVHTAAALGQDASAESESAAVEPKKPWMEKGCSKCCSYRKSLRP